MVYLDYERYKAHYLDAQAQYERILIEQSELFERTQPKGIRYDTDRVTSSKTGNAFDSYLIEKERLKIDERLKEAKKLLEGRLYLLNQKERELRISRDLADTIYRMRFIDRKRIWRVAKETGYSEAQVYRIIQKINLSIKDARK